MKLFLILDTSCQHEVNYALLSGASFTGVIYAKDEIGAYYGTNQMHLKNIGR